MRTRIVVLLCIAVYLLSCNKTKTPEGYFFASSLTKEEVGNKKLTPELLWKFGRVQEFDLSPDGKQIVITIKRYNLEKNKGNAEIFITSSDGSKPFQLTHTLESESNVRWIPGSEKIAFLSSRSGSGQIWQMDKDGKNAIQISNAEGDIESFGFAPVNNMLFYTMRVKTDTSAQDLNPDLPLSTGRVYTDLMYRHWDSWTDYKHSHVFIASLNNNQLIDITDIMKGEPFDAPLSPYYETSEISWSPDGKSLAYTCRKLKGKAEALSTNSDIYLYNTLDSSTTNLSVGMPGYDRSPVISPDGKMICWTSMVTPGYESDKDRLILYNFETKEKKDLTEKFDQSVSNIIWNNNNTEVYFISGIKATFQIYKAYITTGEIVQITKGWHDYTALSRVGNIMIGQKMSLSQASEIFKIDETGKEFQLTFTNKNIYDSIKLGQVKEKWVTTTDKKQMLVWLVLPPNFDSTKQYPALLYCQGGPQSAVSQFFSYRWNLQIMAANGYIVIAPNRRGLPTFGQEWNDQIACNYGGQNMKDYLSAVDALKKEPYINPDKLGAVGASYGGFSVLYLAGHHQKRFKAFIAHCGMFNLESQYASTEEFFFTNHDLGGAYWQTPEPKGFQFSPHRFVQNWDTPIMLISGENDFRIPYTESLQAFNAAQLRGIPSKLLIYPDESHWVLKPQNSVLWQREFFGWLDKWLK